ncbi:hypothetical protein SLS60_003550 [Paraconiothyrium brasiliense]|uniref:Uncharacterized protein n=1 Tax=Paraconiothyrium brasiliense TaxID=300254 RepID=A0ABR3RPT9_9PLEO
MKISRYSAVAEMASTGRSFHDSIAEELGSFIESKSATFACGGLVPMDSFAGEAETTVTSSTSPFALCWDSPNASTRISKLVFPIDDANHDQQASLLKLVEDCQPASFGYKGEDVIDESYRKATKLDRTAFSTDFCPYELGIVDTIAQVLLPIAGADLGTHGVKAELYKLNYGIDAGINALYTHAALVITVPATSERQGLGHVEVTE